MNLRCLLLPFLFSACVIVHAAPPAPAAPAAPAAADAPALDPKALDAVKPKVGEVVTVEGTIVRSGENKTGTVRYLNFTQNYKESVSLALFVSKAPTEFTKEKVDAWVNKKVRATGKLTEFNGSLQIAIEKWDQVVEAP